MNQGRTVFSQLRSFLPDREFRRCVQRYQGDKRLRGFSLLGSISSDGLRTTDLSGELARHRSLSAFDAGQTIPLGFRGKVARSTLADANESHDWRIFADFSQMMIGIARPLHVRDPMGVDLEQNLYALDSITIDLCLSMFPWAKFRRRAVQSFSHFQSSL